MARITIGSAGLTKKLMLDPLTENDRVECAPQATRHAYGAHEHAFPALYHPAIARTHIPGDLRTACPAIAHMPGDLHTCS